MSDDQPKVSIQGILNRIESVWERLFFMTRWLLVPAYVVLIASLGILVAKAFMAFWRVCREFLHQTETETIVSVLHIVDIVLVLNLVLMVIFVGYINFISTLDEQGEGQEKKKDKPGWMDDLDYSGLKVQLLGSILAISSVKLLTYSIELDRDTLVSREKFIWLIAIQVTMVLSVVCLAITNRIKPEVKRADSKS